MTGISKNEAVLRRATKDVAEMLGGKGHAVEARKQVDKVAKFIGGLSDIGLSALRELTYATNDTSVIVKAAKAERDAAKASRKAAKAQPVGAAAE